MKITLLITCAVLTSSYAATISAFSSGTLLTDGSVDNSQIKTHRYAGGVADVAYITFDTSTAPAGETVTSFNFEIAGTNGLEGTETFDIVYMGDFNSGTVNATNIATWSGATSTMTVGPYAAGDSDSITTTTGMTDTYAVYRIRWNANWNNGESMSFENLSLTTEIPVSVPEPSSLALLGLGGLALLSRRKRS